MLQYQNHSNINITHSGCSDTCYATVQAFGFRPDCTKKTLRYDYAPIISAGGGASIKDPRYRLLEQSPKPDAGGDIQGYYNLALTTLYVAEPDGTESGDVEQHSCTLQSGIVEYAIVINNGSVTFRSNDWRDDNFVNDLFLSQYPQQDPQQTDYIIAGFASAASDLFTSSVTMYDSGTLGIVAAFTGL